MHCQGTNFHVPHDAACQFFPSPCMLCVNIFLIPPPPNHLTSFVNLSGRVYMVLNSWRLGVVGRGSTPHIDCVAASKECCESLLELRDFYLQLRMLGPLLRNFISGCPGTSWGRFPHCKITTPTAAEAAGEDDKSVADETRVAAPTTQIATVEDNTAEEGGEDSDGSASEWSSFDVSFTGSTKTRFQASFLGPSFTA